MTLIRRISLSACLLLYVCLAMTGIRFGLPNRDHFFSYSCDESTWIIGLSRIVPERGQFNPYPIFLAPPGYLWIYGAAAVAATQWGYLTPDLHRPPNEARTEIYARLHLVGRYCQVVFGVLALLALGVAAFELFGPLPGILAPALLVVMPSFVAASHFSQANIPVLTLSFLSLYFILRDARQVGTGSLRSLLMGACFAGIAIATKYSAAPLILPLLYQAWKRPDRFRAGVKTVGCLLVGFMVVCPFALFSPQSFWSGAKTLTSMNTGASRGLIQRIIFPFRYPLNYSLGFPFLVLGVVAVWRFLRTKDEAVRCLLIWLGGLLIGTYGVGEKATPARVLIFAPAIALLIAEMISRVFAHGGKGLRMCMGGILGVSWLSSLVLSLMILQMHTRTPIQKQSSEWLRATVPVSSAIGLPRVPFFWTPDVLNSQNAGGTLPQQPFRVAALDYSIPRARTMDYLVISALECNPWIPLAAQKEFCGWVELEKEFTLIQTFDRPLVWGPFVWNRSPGPQGMADDDLWATPLKVYKNSRISR